MIKDIIKRILIYFSIITIMVYLVSYIFFSPSGEYVLVLEILGLSFFLVVIQFLSQNMKIYNVICGIIVEYILISGFVLLYGNFVEWFNKNNWYLVFGYVAVVYVVALLLDIVRVKKDVDFINSALKERRENGEKG